MILRRSGVSSAEPGSPHIPPPCVARNRHRNPSNLATASSFCTAGLLGLVYTQMNPAVPGEGAAAVVEASAGVEAEAEAVPPPPRENAVLVLGATGRLGRRVVAKVR